MTTPSPKPQHPEELEPRVAKLETGQESMSERIDRILGILDTGHGQGDGGASTTTTADPAPAADMAEQMRQAVRDVHAEQAAAAPEPEPEKPPREAGQPLKQRMARVLYGKGERR